MTDRPVAPAFDLSNVGPGPDPCSLAALAANEDFVVLFFQRDDYCTNCRKQVRRVRDRRGAYRARDAVPVSVLPEPRETAREWQERYGLPYPLLADPDAAVAEAYGQTVRFGPLGEVSDFLGRMPKVVVVDARGDEPRIAWTHDGRSTFDRPEQDAVLDVLDDCRA